MDTKPKNGKTPLVKFKDTERGLSFYHDGSAIPCPNEIPVVARVRLNGANAKDNDIVTAFVNGQPRGYGYVEADTGVANCRFSFRLEDGEAESGMDVLFYI